MLRLRLQRFGKRKQPSYRIVVADSRAPRQGRIVEVLGNYNPRSEPAAIVLDKDKALDWIKKGAQPSERVKKLLEIVSASEGGK